MKSHRYYKIGVYEDAFMCVQPNWYLVGNTLNATEEAVSYVTYD